MHLAQFQHHQKLQMPASLTVWFTATGLVFLGEAGVLIHAGTITAPTSCSPGSLEGHATDGHGNTQWSPCDSPQHKHPMSRPLQTINA